MSFIRKIRLKKRLLILFLLISVVPIAAISLFTYNLSSDSSKRKIAESNKQLLSLINTNMFNEIEKYQYVCGSICINEDVQNALLTKNMSAVEKNKAVLKIQDIVKSRIIYPAHAKNITILDSKGKIFYDLGYESINSDDLKIIFDKTTTEDTDSFTYVKNYGGRNMIVLSRKIYSYFNKSTIIGYSLVSIDESLFSKTILNPAQIHTDSNILFMDSYGIVLSSWNREIPLGEKYHSSEIIRNINTINKPSGSFTMNLNDEPQLVTYFYNKDIDKFILSFVPYSYINSEASAIAFDVVLVTLIIICICVFILWAIYSSIAKPVENMASICEEISEGDLDVRIHDDGHDELSFLSQSINSMVSEIENLLETQRIQETQKREIEIQMLQYQINPHFLFNTLNTLKLVAQMNHDDVVSDGIKSLSELLQNTLVNKNEFISIKEELENLKNYMAIMKIRYAGCFEEKFHIDESFSECRIPKLILQPIVENSIVHGSGSDGRLITVTITCEAQNDDILITIEDDGKGFNLNSLSTKPASASPLKGLGVENVDQRIKLSFGQEYGLTIDSKENEGTRCYILIPKIKL